MSRNYIHYGKGTLDVSHDYALEFYFDYCSIDHWDLCSLLSSIFLSQAPTPDIVDRHDPTHIASSYFRTFHAAMLKVITANYIPNHTGKDKVNTWMCA